MKNIHTPLKIFLIAVLATPISACSKTIEWEEEVPLNTGETIIVKREDIYVRRSVPGNPFQMGWWIDERKYKFSWQGNNYKYKNRHSIGPMILWAYPEYKTVAMIDSGRPYCSGYAEFRWTNTEWSIQKNVNPEIIGSPRNLMDYYSATQGKIPSRVTQEFIRNSGFDLPQRGGSFSHLDASETATNCSWRKSP